MGFLNLFRPKVPQAVLVYLDGQNLSAEVYEACDLATLEELLIPVLEESGAGEYDGEETGPSETCVFLYGADAERLFSTIEPVLNSYPLCSGARVVVRRGGPGAVQRELRLPVV